MEMQSRSKSMESNLRNTETNESRLLYFRYNFGRGPFAGSRELAQIIKRIFNNWPPKIVEAENFPSWFI